MRTAVNRWVESVGHYSGVSPIVSEGRKLRIYFDDAEPCRVVVILVQNVLFSGCCLNLQNSIDFLGDMAIGFLMRNGSWSFPLLLMRRLLFPTTRTESAFADVAVSPVCTVSFTTIAELIARFPQAWAPALGRLSLDVSGKATMSADSSTAG